MKRLTLPLSLLFVLGIPILAMAVQHETPTLASERVGFAKVVLTVETGTRGAPAGFTILWMDRSEFLQNGSRWTGNVDVKYANFNGQPTLNTWGGMLQTFISGSRTSVTVEIGDLFDETGVESNWAEELAPGSDYVFTAIVNPSSGVEASEMADVVYASTRGGQDCTFTIGYWKTHPLAWPVEKLTLGTVEYQKQQLLDIFNEPVAGNGLISLAHQLIATELNIANGANPTDVESARTDAHNLINGLIIPPKGGGFLDPSTTSATTQTLDDYNNGVIGPGHCPTAVEDASWATVKAGYR